jgi:hypothetical protein
MSIDLYVDLTRPVSLRPLLPKAGAVLAEMLGLPSIPDLTLHVLENGQREAVARDELRDESSPLFLISISGEPETVSLNVSGEHVTVIMGAQRNNLEYALGAAVATALARELGGVAIGDDWGFFGGEVLASPEDFLQRLKITGTGHDYREAAEQLGSRLKWGDRRNGSA